MSESRRFVCPLPDYAEITVDDAGKQHIESDYYITLPPKWLGKHAIAHTEAAEAAEGAGLKGVVFTFAVSLALADDYNLPGLSGKPQNWDFSELDLELITWVNFIVYGSYNRDFTVKKTYLLASLNGHVTTSAAAATGEIGTM